MMSYSVCSTRPGFTQFLDKGDLLGHVSFETLVEKVFYCTVAGDPLDECQVVRVMSK